MKYYYKAVQKKVFKLENNHSYIPYLVLLTICVGFPLFMDEFRFSNLNLDIIRLFMIGYSLFLPQKINYLLWFIGSLALYFIFSMWGHQNQALYPFKQASLITFFLVLIIILFKEILFSDISKKMIYQTLAAYILIGMIFAQGFRFIHFFSPEAFNFSISQEVNHIYLSFIVFTSVGMGDLLPLSSSAKAAVMLEAILGQIYIAFFVSMMVGKYIRGQIS